MYLRVKNGLLWQHCFINLIAQVYKKKAHYIWKSNLIFFLLFQMGKELSL